MNTETIFTEVQVNYPITEDSVRNLLVSALEGGSNYWMSLLKYEFPPNTTREDFTEGQYTVPDGNDNWPIAYVLPFVPRGGIVLQDKEEDCTHTLIVEKIVQGLRTMANKYPTHFMDFINENDDAETADVFLQCCIFGEIVYG